MTVRILPLSLLLFTLLAFTQSNHNIYNKYPTDYFSSPVKHTMRLAGTFGELRPNHFHAGIDIKSSKGKAGDPIYAPADGYISRVKILSGSYGNALYLAHPNGYTTVYGHLASYTKQVAKWIETQQYDREKFEINLYPTAQQFPVKKGQRIGTMGNSGRSYGPHLHFEIRDTRTQKAINPLLFGLKMQDTRAPKMHELKVYSLNEKKEQTNQEVFKLKKATNTSYTLPTDTIEIGAWRIGMALKVYDHHNNVSNWNGIFRLEMFVDDSLHYAFEMEKIGFDKMRYINAHLDYCEQVEDKSYFNRMFQLPGNVLDIYTNKTNEGVISLSQNKAKKVSLVASDLHGNQSTLDFWIKRGQVQEPKSKIFNYFLPWNEANKVLAQDMELSMPNNTLYENLYLYYNASNDKSSEFFSAVHQIHDYKTPVHKYFDLAIRPNKSIPKSLRSKAFIAYCYKDKFISFGGKWENGTLKTKVRDLGDFAIMVDTVKPEIKPIRFQKDLRGATYISFKVTDNFQTDNITKGMRFRAEIDGKWALLKYDAKNDLLRHDFRNDLPRGNHILRLVATDDRNNSKVYEREFIR